MRTGWFRQAYVKTDGAYRLKLLLTHRRNLKRKFLDLENAIRHSPESFGVRLNKVGRGGFERRVRKACAGDPFTAELMQRTLTARAALWRQYLKLDWAGRARRAVPAPRGSERWQSGASIEVQEGHQSRCADHHSPRLARRDSQRGRATGHSRSQRGLICGLKVVIAM